MCGFERRSDPRNPDGHQANRSARLLLVDGDVDGACDQAYYAMFNAAKAVSRKNFLWPCRRWYHEASRSGLHLCRPKQAESGYAGWSLRTPNSCREPATTCGWLLSPGTIWGLWDTGRVILGGAGGRDARR